MNTLHLGLSYNCNMKCKHCFVNKGNDRLDINKLYESIDYLDNNGLFFIVYTFGEPLLSKNFFEVSKYVKEKNIVQILMTNGSIINDRIIKKLKENGINNIFVSIDSKEPKKHDENRGTLGAYNKAINALKKIKENGINVGIATTINDSNVEEMNDIVDMAKKIGIKTISFLRQRSDGKIIKMKLIDNYYEFYNNYLKNYSKYNINLIFHDFNLLSKTKKLYNDGYISTELYEKYIDMNSCHYKDTISIEPNGNVKNCNLLNGSIGNINNETLEKIIKKRGDTSESISNCS